MVGLKEKNLQICRQLLLHNKIVRGKPQTKILKPSIQERNEKYLPLCKELSNIVKGLKNINHDLRILRIWAHEMRKLEEKEGVPYERMKKVLNWYSKNHGGQFIPVVECGYTFRIKFTKLEAAMNRKPFTFSNLKPYVFNNAGAKYILHPDGKYRHVRTGELYIENT